MSDNSNAPMNPAAPRVLPSELAAAVRKELAPGEAVTWQDQPVARGILWISVMLTGAGLVLAALGVIQTIGGMKGTGLPVTDPDAPAWLPAAMWALMMLAGLAIMATPLLIRRSLRRTVYVLTDRRAILLQGMLWGLRVRSFEPAALAGMQRKNRSHGIGDLIFTSDTLSVGNSGTRQVPVGFLFIRNPDTVEAMVRELAGRPVITVEPVEPTATASGRG